MKKTKELTPELAFEIPLEEAERFCSNDYVRAEETLPETAPRLQSRWTSVLQGPAVPALETVYCEKGEHVAENVVSPFGICRLKIMQLGAPVRTEIYMEQIAVRVGVNGLSGWTWIDRSGGQEIHYLLLVWKQE